MKKNTLFALWGGLFILCAGLGFIRFPSAFAQNLMTFVSVCFFVPPILLLIRYRENRKTVALVRNLSILSLSLTLILMILNIVCAMGSETLGSILNSILTVVSSPMVCAGSWVLSLFLWACLMVVSLTLLRKSR